MNKKAVIQTREIGSEFHRMPCEHGKGLVLPKPYTFTFSGRTAIETVLKDIPDIKRVLLPAYCCDSMIEPFRKARKKICFYPVNDFDGLKIEIETANDVDAILWCNYFGYKKTMPDFSAFTDRGGIIIEDITHSLLSDQPYHKQSHYLVASIRKWEPITCGGYCVKVGGVLNHRPTLNPPKEFVELKTSAMELKTQYLSKMNEGNKSIFLSKFIASNHWLAEHYSGLAIDSQSQHYLETVNIEQQKAARIRNAKKLYQGLNNKVRFLFPEEDMDCPLFVPILLSNRDEARRVLTENGVYCPVHWPKPAGCESNLYDKELSLICDQRYNDEDMEYIISIMKKIH